MNIKRLLTIIFLSGLTVFCFYSRVFSAPNNQIVINELMWTGSKISSSDEWIELENLTDQDIDLSGWKIKYPNDNEMVSISSGTIPANGYFLIANSDESHQYSGGESILAVVPDYIDSGVSLSNENLQIKLIDQDDNLIDTAGNGDKPLAGNNDKKYSMERNDIIADGTLAPSWHTATDRTNLDSNREEKATPKFKNSPPLFQTITNYPEVLDKYITVGDCLETEGIVNYIVDGDTIDIELNGETRRIRLLGIDAPESKNYSDFKTDEPYCQESKNYLNNLLLGKNVKVIVSNDSNAQYDNYERLLAVILLGDEIINISSIKEGLSKTYYLDTPILKSDSWLAEESYAQENHYGIWKYYGLNSGIFINEIMPNPEGKDSENEWIEIYNSTNQNIDLGNWFLDDAEYGSKPYLIPANTTIAPSGYLVIHILDSQIALNNSGDNVRLYTPDLNIAHEIVYSRSAKENISFMRDNDNKYKWTKTPTKGAKNIYSDPDKPDYKKVNKINDLKNLDSNTHVEITGYANTNSHQISDQYFYIEDDSGGVQIYNYDKKFTNFSIGQKLKIFGQISDSKILRVKIDNSSDIILLDQKIVFNPPKFYPSEVKKDYIGKLIVVKGEVSKLSGQIFYIKDQHSELKIQIRGPTNFKRPDLSRGDIIEVTGLLYQSSRGNITLLPRFIFDILIIKKNKTNSTKDNPIIIDNIRDLKYLNEDDYVLVRGIVNCLPGMLSEQYFYIQDETSGVQIYSYYKRFPQLQIGDYIEVMGVLSASKQRIKTYSIDNFLLIGSGNNINPVTIRKNTRLEEYFGCLVFTSGIVIGKKNNKITISIDGNKFVIYLKDATGIKPSILKVGDMVKIYGIIDEYQGEYRINPRFLEDIYYEHKINTQKSSKDGNVNGNSTKSFFKVRSLPKLSKYLAKAPQNSYNQKTFENIIKTSIIILQLILLILIVEWLWKKQFSSKTSGN